MVLRLLVFHGHPSEVGMELGPPALGSWVLGGLAGTWCCDRGFQNVSCTGLELQAFPYSCNFLQLDVEREEPENVILQRAGGSFQNSSESVVREARKLWGSTSRKARPVALLGTSTEIVPVAHPWGTRDLFFLRMRGIRCLCPGPQSCSPSTVHIPHMSLAR